jgi:hypothetical protein
MTATFSESASSAEFLKRLYSPVDDGHLEIRGIDPTGRLPKRSQSEWFPVTQPGELDHAVAFAHSLNVAGYDVFLGVNPRINHGLEDEDVLSGCALWADCDDLASLSAAEAKVEEALSFALKPDAAVYTGGGVHLYWFLKETVDPADKPAWSVYLRSLKAMCNQFGGDTRCCNPSRVLRFPLSISHKRGVKTLLWLREEVPPSLSA